MKQKAMVFNYIPEKVLIVLFFVFALTFATTGFAEDFKIETTKGTFVNVNILYASAEIKSDRLSISYDGISNDRRMESQSKKSSHLLESENLPGVKFEPPLKNNASFKVAQKFKATAEYLLRYIKLGSFLSDSRDLIHLIESKVKTNKVRTENFDFNLSISIGHNDDKIINMEAINFESYWNNTYVNAVYHFEKNEIDFSLSNAHINKYLINGMKLELQANPIAKSGMILLTKSL